MPTTLEEWLRLTALIAGAYFVALWIALTVWAFRDTAMRTRDLFLRLFLPLFVAFFSVLGLPLYLLLRPQHTIAEQYERSLEEEALLREMETDHACPTCKAPVQEDYLLCPVCRTPLREPCLRCQRPLHPSWQVCPYCGYEMAPALAPQQQPRSLERGLTLPLRESEGT